MVKNCKTHGKLNGLTLKFAYIWCRMNPREWILLKALARKNEIVCLTLEHETNTVQWKRWTAVENRTRRVHTIKIYFMPSFSLKYPNGAHTCISSICTNERQAINVQNADEHPCVDYWWTEHVTWWQFSITNLSALNFNFATGIFSYIHTFFIVFCFLFSSTNQFPLPLAFQCWHFFFAIPIKTYSAHFNFLFRRKFVFGIFNVWK